MHHPSPAIKPSPVREVEKMVEEAERQVEEARWLEDVGRSLSSSANLTVGPDGCRGQAICFGEEPVWRKLLPTVGGKAP